MRRLPRLVVASPEVGGRDGISAVTREMIAALRPVSGAVDVWSLLERERPTGLPDDVAFHGAGGSRVAFAALPWRRAHEGAVIVALHVHLLPALLPLQYRGRRVVPVLHGIETWTPVRRLESMALRRAWRVLAVSVYTARRFREANPALAATPIHVCPSGVPAAASPSARRFAGPYALIVGRMAIGERYKGHDGLLELWPSVRLAVPSARLVVVGDGDDRERLETEAARRGLAEAVQFTGSVGDADLAALYRGASVFVMPSRGEGFGLVYLEAMRAGTPCIAAPGAAEEIIEHGVSGFIADPADVATLTGMIISLFTNEPLRCAMGRAAADRVDTMYSPPAYAARLQHALDPDAEPVTC